MKNLFIAACAFAVLALTSCQKEDVADNNIAAKTYDVTLATNMNSIANNLGDFNVVTNSPMQSQAAQLTPATEQEEYGFVESLTITLAGNGSTIDFGPIVFTKDATTHELTSLYGISAADVALDFKHYVKPDGTIYLHNIPLGNYTISITATNGHDVELLLAGGGNGQFAFHKDYSDYPHSSQAAREEILNWIQLSDDLGCVYNAEEMYVPVRKDWVSNEITTAVPAMTGSERAPQLFELKLQNDLFAMLLHRKADQRIRVNSYVMLNTAYVPAQENQINESICSYYNCQDKRHTDYMTAFQDNLFSLLSVTPIDADNYSLFLVVTDLYDKNENIGCLRIPLQNLIGGKVHFAEIVLDRTSVRIKNLDLSFESFSIEEWVSDIFITGEISVEEVWPLNPGEVTSVTSLGL